MELLRQFVCTYDEKKNENSFPLQGEEEGFFFENQCTKG